MGDVNTNIRINYLEKDTSSAIGELDTKVDESVITVTISADMPYTMSASDFNKLKDAVEKYVSTGIKMCKVRMEKKISASSYKKYISSMISLDTDGNYYIAFITASGLINVCVNGSTRAVDIVSE